MSDITETLAVAPIVASMASAASDVSPAVERQEVAESGKPSPQQEDTEVTREQVAEAVSEITAYVQNISRELQFQVDDNLGTTIVTVLDRETSEFIRQIPTEDVVKMARYIAENAPDPVKGLLMNGEG